VLIWAILCPNGAVIKPARFDPKVSTATKVRALVLTATPR